MKQRMFSVFDSKTSAWGPPFFAQHLGQAMRMWGEIANDGQSMVSKYPDDFCLYEVGSWDDQSGVVEAISPVTMIQTGKEAKRVPETAPMFPEQRMQAALR